MDYKAGLREKIVLGVLVALLVSGGVWRAVQHSTPGPRVLESGLAGQETIVDAEPEMITVHLAGAVLRPGIYHLPGGSRVYEVLEMGGGFSGEAEADSLNLARPLLDGEQIYVQRAGEAPQVSTSGGSAKININTASASDLTALPGIGDVRAAQIVAHREKHGFFKDIREIMDVSGIGDKTFENIADLITIY